MSYKIQTGSSCEVIAFDIPPSAGATVTIGTKTLVPSPFVNIDVQKFTTNDVVIGGIWKIQLNGTVVGESFDAVSGEIKSILELAKNSDCVDVTIQCSETFISGKGRVITVSANEGSQPSWVTRASYSIEIDLYTNEGSPVVPPGSGNGLCDNMSNWALQDISEQFTLNINEDSFNWGTPNGTTMDPTGVGNRHVKVSFSVNARGIGTDCSSDGDIKFGLAAAEEYMLCRLEKLKDMDLTGIANEPVLVKAALDEYRGGASFMDFRSIEIDPFSSAMNISGEIIYRPSGCHEKVFTSVTVEENLDVEGSEITISGTVTGLVDVDYTDLIRAAKYLDDTTCSFNDKMTNANEYFDLFKDSDNIKNIALQHLSSPSYIVDPCGVAGEDAIPCFSASVNPSPELCDLRITSSQVSRDYSAGQINFSFRLSTKPGSCAIPGVSNLEIEATHDIPRDNIVEIIVPGRGAKGALIQNLCCLSSEKWSFNINMTLANKGCKLAPQKTITELRDCSNQLIDKFINDSGIDELDSNPRTNCWFVTDNQETIGRNTYRFSIQYTKPSCP